MIKKKRNFIENKFVNRKLEKGGWSVPQAPVHYIEKCMSVICEISIIINIAIDDIIQLGI